jgi:hypothetical protein
MIRKTKIVNYHLRCSTPPPTVIAKTPDFPMVIREYPEGFSSFHDVPVGLLAETPTLLCIPPVRVMPQTCPPGPASNWVSLPVTGNHDVPIVVD